MNEYINIFSKIFSLTQHEAKIYFASVDLGKTSSLTEITKKSRISRTAAYSPVKSLISKGFLSCVNVGKRKKYLALKPDSLPNILERKKIDLDEIIKYFNKSINVSENDFSVQFFQGTEGIHAASNIFLDETKDGLWKTFENPSYVMSKVGFLQFSEFNKKRIKMGIRCRVIIPETASTEQITKKTDQDKKYLGETITISSRLFPIEASIGATKGMILIIIAKKNSYAVLIKSEELSLTIGSIHDIIWDRYAK